jgi:polysaccharide biosynthesis protein PslG
VNTEQIWGRTLFSASHATLWLRQHWHWLLRAAVFMWLLRLIAPPQPYALLGAPQTVITTQPHLCVHTRLMDEVDEWKIQRTLVLVREMGAPTIVEFFPWAYIETEQGQYNWTAVDRIVRHAQNQGIRIIARLGLVPAWARPSNDERQTTLNELHAESYDDFARFAAAFAARYAGVIDHWIIWNEPNLSFEWGYRPVNAAEYIEMLRVVYAAIHAAQPNAIVIAAPLAPTLEPVGSAAGLDDLLYFREMYAAGLAEVSDGIAMHTYGFTAPPGEAPAPDLLNYRRAELHRVIMQEYDDSDTPVFITEMGWNDHPRWTKAVSPSQRIAYTLDALAYSAQEWMWAETVCLWVMRFPAPTGSYPDDFTLVTPDFQLKPIYHALQAYGRGWSSGEPLWLPPPT